MSKTEGSLVLSVAIAGAAIMCIAESRTELFYGGGMMLMWAQGYVAGKLLGNAGSND